MGVRNSIMKLIVLTALLATCCAMPVDPTAHRSFEVVPETDEPALTLFERSAETLLQSQAFARSDDETSSDDEDVISSDEEDSGSGSTSATTADEEDSGSGYVTTEQDADGVVEEDSAAPTDAPTTYAPTTACDCSCYDNAYMCYADGTSETGDERCSGESDDSSDDSSDEESCTQHEAYCYDGGYNDDNTGCTQGGDSSDGWGDEAGECCSSDMSSYYAKLKSYVPTVEPTVVSDSSDEE